MSKKRNVTIIRPSDHEMKTESTPVLPGSIPMESDMKVNDWFFSMFDVFPEDIGYDADLTLTRASAYFAEHGGVPMPKAGYASRFPLYTTVLTLTMLLMNRTIMLHQWYKACFPDDPLAEDLDPTLTADGIYDAMLAGVDFYDYIRVADSQMRTRIFCALCAVTGYGYGEIYDLWIHGPSARHTI